MGSTLNATNEEILCPFCGKGKISFTKTEGYYVYRTSRTAGKSKQIPEYHEPRVVVDNKCPECGKSKSELKEAIEKGSTKQISHEERLKQIKDAGLPTRIVNTRR